MSLGEDVRTIFAFLRHAQVREWSYKDLDAVESKLKRVRIVSLNDFIATVLPKATVGINKILGEGGEKRFTSETLAALTEAASSLQAPLVQFLKDALPSWTEKLLRTAHEKLLKVGVQTLDDVIFTLSPGSKNGLNKRLTECGEKRFSPETLAALREHADQLVKSGADLREFLQSSRSSWTGLDVRRIEVKLASIGIHTAEELVSALLHDSSDYLNGLLRAAGQSKFHSQTLLEMRTHAKQRQGCSGQSSSTSAASAEASLDELEEPPPASTTSSSALLREALLIDLGETPSASTSPRGATNAEACPDSPLARSTAPTATATTSTRASSSLPRHPAPLLYRLRYRFPSAPSRLPGLPRQLSLSRRLPRHSANAARDGALLDDPEIPLAPNAAPLGASSTTSAASAEASLDDSDDSLAASTVPPGASVDDLDDPLAASTVPPGASSSTSATGAKGAHLGDSDEPEHAELRSAEGGRMGDLDEPNAASTTLPGASTSMSAKSAEEVSVGDLDELLVVGAPPPRSGSASPGAATSAESLPKLSEAFDRRATAPGPASPGAAASAESLNELSEAFDGRAIPLGPASPGAAASAESVDELSEAFDRRAIAPGPSCPGAPTSAESLDELSEAFDARATSLGVNWYDYLPDDCPEASDDSLAWGGEPAPFAFEESDDETGEAFLLRTMPELVDSGEETDQVSKSGEGQKKQEESLLLATPPPENVDEDDEILSETDSGEWFFSRPERVDSDGRTEEDLAARPEGVDSHEGVDEGLPAAPEVDTGEGTEEAAAADSRLVKSDDGLDEIWPAGREIDRDEGTEDAPAADRLAVDGDDGLDEAGPEVDRDEGTEEAPADEPSGSYAWIAELLAASSEAEESTPVVEHDEWPDEASSARHKEAEEAPSAEPEAVAGDRGAEEALPAGAEGSAADKGAEEALPRPAVDDKVPNEVSNEVGQATPASASLGDETGQAVVPPPPPPPPPPEPVEPPTAKPQETTSTKEMPVFNTHSDFPVVLGCATPNCKLLTHSSVKMGAYCCLRCLNTGVHSHGPECEHRRAWAGMRKATRGWRALPGSEVYLWERQLGIHLRRLCAAEQAPGPVESPSGWLMGDDEMKHLMREVPARLRGDDFEALDRAERFLCLQSKGVFQPRALAAQYRRQPSSKRVSVVVPTMEKRGQWHQQLYETFASQSWPDKELVVVETYFERPSQFFSACKDEHVVYLSFKVQKGRDFSIGLKRNMGTYLSSGAFIANFDDDDLYAPGYLETMVEAMERDSSSAITLGSWHIFDCKVGRFGYVSPRQQRHTWRVFDLDHTVFGYGFSYVSRREVALEIPYPDWAYDPSFSAQEDWEFFTAIRIRNQRRQMESYGRVNGFINFMDKCGTTLLDDETGICLHTLHSTSTSDSFAQRELTPKEIATLEVRGLGKLYEDFLSRYPRKTGRSNFIASR